VLLEVVAKSLKAPKQAAMGHLCGSASQRVLRIWVGREIHMQVQSAHITRLLRGSECTEAGNKHVIDVLENFFKLNRHHHSDSISSLVAARAPKFG
jgi:hypothetical protein